ncbi:hypothetical protein CKO15_13005 [Halorhodospira abdelmalekii]|nr:hypothetical protein [Halorhodospira abdelmalekii]
MAAHWSISVSGGAGIRVVMEFLENSGLAAFIGTSYGTQQAFQAELENHILACADEQREALAQKMPHRTLSIAEDETWKDGMRLVAIDPVSGFIVVEQVSEDRSAAAWTKALESGLEGLNVTIIQGTSDEAKGLLAHVQRDLGAHHSTDLFHMQHEVNRATSLPLARAEQQAEKGERMAKARLEIEHIEERSYREQSHGPGRPPAFAARIERAEDAKAQAILAHERAQALREEARELNRTLSEVDHPYDLENGQARSPERLAEQLKTIFSRLAEISEEVNLSSKLCAHLAKAKRLTRHLVNTLAFFFMTVQARVDSLCLAPAIEQALLDHLIPGVYLSRVADRSDRAEERHRLHAMSAKLLEPLQQASHPIQSLDLETRQYLEQFAEECADLFQRSSSCVEGRNGYLALHQHGHHRLSHRKQRVLTALHNFATKRADGTTPAERLVNGHLN